MTSPARSAASAPTSAGAGINIANMAVSRSRQGGKALMALSIDTAAPPELEQQLRAEGFDEVHVIALG